MIKPLGHNLLLQELPPRPRSDGGIMIPEAVRQDPTYRVVAIGPDCDRELAPGDRVVLDQFKLNAKADAGPGLWIVKEDSVAIIIPHETPPQTAASASSSQ